MKKINTFILVVFLISIGLAYGVAVEQKYKQQAEAFKIDEVDYKIEKDDATKTKEDQDFTKTEIVTRGAGTYNECISELTTWQERVAKQEAICNGMRIDKDKLEDRPEKAIEVIK